MDVSLQPAENTHVTAKTIVAAALALAVCTALQGCGKYGLKGDRGLPPPPENMAYPNINEAPTGSENRPLKSRSEQAQIRSELAARKRQR